MTDMGNIGTPGKIAHHTPADKSSQQEIVFWDEDNPRCVVNMLSEKLKERALEIPTHFLSLSDDMLEKATEPTMVHEHLRLAFWDEYFVASDNNKKMRVESVYPRVCSRDYFYRVFIADDLNLAYMMRPPVEYTLKMRSLLELGHRQIEKVLRMPLINSKGQPDAKLIAEVVKIVALLDNRVKGSVTQKVQIEQKTQGQVHHVHQSPKSITEIQNEINRIDIEMKHLTKPPKLFDDIEAIGARVTDVGARESE